MKDYLTNYVKEIDKLLKENKKRNWQEIKEKHLIKIGFFQHERLIHLLVTLFYGLFMFISLYLTSINPLFAIITLLLLCFLIPYISYYFYIENKVQYLYVQYDKIVEKIEN
jgi:hypothetical protein